MTHAERLIPLLSEWLEGQPDRAPSRLLDVVLTDLQSTPQSARWQLVLRRFPMLTSTGARYFAVAAVAVLAVVIVGGLWAGRPGGVGAPPTPTSAPTATSHTPSP